MADSATATYIPQKGDRVRYTKRGPIWLWYESGVVGASWPDQREGWLTLDERGKCGECGRPTKRTSRFRFDEIAPADAPIA